MYRLMYYRPGRKVLLSLLGLFALVALLVSRPAGVSADPPDHEDAVQAYNRDVYVIVGSTLRNPTAETSPEAPLFNIAGVSLDLTWGQWQTASAAATAHIIGGPNSPRTDARIELSGLVPGGVYSIFYGTIQPDSENPLCPGVERTLGLTAFHADQQLPDASSFIADANGQASYHGRVDGNLLDAYQSFYFVIYHFDGQTYHPLPNRGEFLTQGDNCRSSFGEDAMRQLVIFQKS
ncbi:MAG: hypothetical protein L0332_05435 [Chloroflexi bacterium]|nr:hypothetical protein [Chloroflexota bacterium]MCI0579915.1 hypothetical protein [Chloroflexota bacterium]MCI0646498.1 hypothetical protein [Chloroflexota bacterium]MCI0726150.1 hypothetical protein [Chloroflexota bacterium]